MLIGNMDIVLPTAKSLKLGYYSACLTLVTRKLEIIGENLQSRIFMPGSAAGETHLPPSRTDEATDSCDDLRRALRRSCSSLAENVLNLFLDLGPSLKGSLTTEMHLCVAYCVLIIAHYDESQSGLSDEHCLSLVQRIHDYYEKLPEFSRLPKFPKLAQRTLQSRLRGAPIEEDDSEHRWTSRNRSVPHGCEISDASDQITLDQSQPIGFLPDLEIPSMQDFFGGGFLDFLQPSPQD